MTTNSDIRKHHVVIVGGGFGGLRVAQGLGRAGVRTTLIDKRNYHLFQPLLYQVAAGFLSPGDIAVPLRSVLRRAKSVVTLLGEMVDLDPDARKVILSDGEVSYDTLVIATGSTPHYFGHDAWRSAAPGLKSLDDAFEVRRRVLLAFEAAERETDVAECQACLTFVVVGGGATGVELSGTLAELAHLTLRDDFRNFDPRQTTVLLVEGLDRILSEYPPYLSARAADLTELGVTVRTRTFVTDIDGATITLATDGHEERVRARTILWTAGIRGAKGAQVLAERTGAELDRMGRVIVEPDLTVPGHPEIFVIGDLAGFNHQEGAPLPPVANVAIQEGQYVVKAIRARMSTRKNSGFRYRSRGKMAIIGRRAAIALAYGMKVTGLAAWLLWLFLHIFYLIGFETKVLVFFRWVWNYITRRRGVRLITGGGVFPLV